MNKKIDGLVFNNNGELEEIKGFTTKCKCGSDNVTCYYEFNYYGGATGYDQHFKMICRDCKNEFYIPL